MNITNINFINEFALTEKAKEEIALLQATCFPETRYYGRHYFKQLPHARIIISDEVKTIAQVGIDYRVMNLNEKLVHVMGAIGVAVEPAHQGKGLGKKLMMELEKLALRNKNNVDFIFLVTDIPVFYEKLGYQRISPTVTWMKIYESKSIGMGHIKVDDCYPLYKKVSDKEWEDGELDMLGYWY